MGKKKKQIVWVIYGLKTKLSSKLVKYSAAIYKLSHRDDFLISNIYLDDQILFNLITSEI